MKISAVMCVKNVAGFVEPALKSLNFVDEIVVVDTNSSDDTVKIAKKYTSNVYSFKKEVNYVEPVRNFAISKATGDWILIVDADETIPKKLAQKLKEIANSETELVADCYYLARKNIIFNKWVKSAGWWPDYILRFFKKRHVEWSDEIHSIPFTTGRVEELPATEDLSIQHQNYQTMDQFIERMNRYTSIQADEISKNQSKKLSPKQVVRSFSDELLSRLFDRGGITGGLHGLTLSISQAFSEFLVQVKVWQKQGFPDQESQSADIEQQVLYELSRLKRNMAYWIADQNVKRTRGISNLIWRIRRKLSW